MKVLLVDDEEKFVSSLAERLSFRGFETHWISDCYEAIEHVKKNRYDIAVLDMKMPCMSGIDLKRKLQELDPAMHFVFVSGHGSDDNFEDANKEGGSYIVKPFKIEILVDRLNSIMGA